MRRPYFGWYVAGACFVGTFVIFGVSYSFGVFLERLLETFGESRGATSLAFGVQTAAIYVGASVAGALVDRYGPRRMMLVATVVTAAGLVLASRADSIGALLLSYGVFTGLGLSVVYIVSYTTVTKWFDRRLGLAGGIASAGLGIGMFVAVPAVAWLLTHVHWRVALLVLATSSAALLLVATAVLRSDPRSADVAPPAAEFSEGLPPADGRSLRDRLVAVRPIASSPAFALLFVSWVLVYGTTFLLLAHLILVAVDLGLSRATGAMALALVGLTSVVGRVAIGHLGDRVGRLHVFVGCSAVMGLATVGLLGVRSSAGMVLVAIVYGAAYGGNGALLAPLMADLFGRTDINAVFGLASVAFAVAGLLAPAAGGAVYDALGTYEPALLVSGLLAVIGAGAVAVAGRLAGSPVSR